MSFLLVMAGRGVLRKVSDWFIWHMFPSHDKWRKTRPTTLSRKSQRFVTWTSRVLLTCPPTPKPTLNLPNQPLFTLSHSSASYVPHQVPQCKYKDNFKKRHFAAKKKKKKLLQARKRFFSSQSITVIHDDSQHSFSCTTVFIKVYYPTLSNRKVGFASFPPE